MVMARKDLGEILVAKGIISADELAQAREVQRSAPGDIGRIITDLGFAPDKEVTKAKADLLGLQYVDLTTQRIDESVANSIPERIAKQHKLIAIGKSGGKLIVAIAEPSNPMALQDVRLVAGNQTIMTVLAPEDDIEDAIRRVYKVSSKIGRAHV